ncbi:MAG: choice-of-anchor D domain-containing protein [Candidatus Marinimicrobia bacterium]|nr:choice-of-anchor D domain-containing protein [Candidatus Neomarinimicrobiota bacterium]
MKRLTLSMLAIIGLIILAWLWRASSDGRHPTDLAHAAPGATARALAGERGSSRLRPPVQSPAAHPGAVRAAGVPAPVSKTVPTASASAPAATNQDPVAPPTPSTAGQLAAAAPPAEPPPAYRSAADMLEDADMSDPVVRARIAAQLQAASAQRREAVLAKARALGIAARIITEDGRVMELQDFDGDRPLYYGTRNANAAISGGVIPLRSAPYTLEGAGQMVGIWDGGSVRSTHQEWPGRITLKNSSAAIDDHATHVAGTMAAAGVQAAAKGMAPATAIHSYDWNSDLAEMAAAGAASATDTGRLPLSNHSYGYLAGYTWVSANRWRWFGTGTTATGAEQDFGKYNTYTRDWDALAYSLPYYTIFNAGGNDRNDNPAQGDQVDSASGLFLFTYDSATRPGGDGTYRSGYENISYAALAKNIITVGAVNDAVSGGQRSLANATMSTFSSWGPADDGRIKPDLVANGVSLYSALASGNSSYGSYSGTSMASPAAAGAAALLVQLHRREFADQLPPASLLKALLIHTADELGNPGPDYRFGWGLINAERAAALMLEHKNSAGSPKFIADQITAGSPTVSHSFTWDGVSPIRATLCWTDPAGVAQTTHDNRTPALVHNLDLVVTGPGSQVFRPYIMPFVGTWTAGSMAQAATTGKNNVDNVEQVHIAAPPAAGTYTATVTLDGSLTRSAQAFALVITGGTTATAETRVINLQGDLAFGAVAVGQTASRSLTIQNLGNAALTVTGLQLPAGFSGSWSGSLAPGAAQAVSITFSPTQAATYSGTARVLSNATSGQDSVAVSGTGVATVTPLANGVAVGGLAGAQGAERFFVLSVPAGQATLQFVISGGGGGDADLYVRLGGLPSTSQWDYRPYLEGSDETVLVTNPAAGDWYVMIRGYTAYTALTLSGTYASPTQTTRILRLTGDLAYGNIPVGDRVDRILTLHNDGNAPLTVTGITLPDGFEGDWSGSIPAGGQQAVTITFAPLLEQAYDGQLTVASDKTAGDNSRPLSGNGIINQIPLQNGVAAGPFNSLAGGMIFFYLDVPAGQNTLTVTVEDADYQADIYVRRDTPPTLETYDQRASDAGDPHTVVIGTPAAGRWHIMLYALTQYTGARLIAAYGATAGARDIRLEGDLEFGTLRVNETATRAFAIHNDGNAPLNVSGITYPPGYSGGGAVTVQPGAQHPVNVTFAPTPAGNYDGVLTVQSDATAGGNSLPLAGSALAPGDAIPLENGIPLTGLAGAADSERLYMLEVPPGATLLRIVISGGTGDADLYVRRDSAPTLDDWDYRPYLYGNDETVEVENPAAGVWYVLVHAWESYTGVTLLAYYEMAQGSSALGEAVDAPHLTWTTDGHAAWFAQTAVTQDGVDAARSGALTHSQQSWMQTTVTGPGVVSFWWRVSSEEDYDFLRFHIGGAEQQRISGTVDWQRRSFPVPAGTHTLQWQYDKDSSVTSGSDCGWVDQVRWQPDGGEGAVYRFWSPVQGAHFFTISVAERDYIMTTWPDTWTYEGPAWYAYATPTVGATPVYRFWSPVYGTHFFTITKTERDHIIAAWPDIWSYEGIAWYAHPVPAPGTAPIYRFWSPVYGAHFFTISEAEKDMIVAAWPAIWTYEGIAYYAYTSPVGVGQDDPDARMANAARHRSITPPAAPPPAPLETDAPALPAPPAAIPSARPIDAVTESVYIPLGYDDAYVTAVAYDFAAAVWNQVLAPTWAPAGITIPVPPPPQRHWLAIWVHDPEPDTWRLAQGSWFGRLPPTAPDLSVTPQSLEPEPAIGRPRERLLLPASDNRLILRLYCPADAAYIAEVAGLPGGTFYDLDLPAWNRWYWAGVWDAAENRLLGSVWLGHFRTH